MNELKIYHMHKKCTFPYISDTLLPLVFSKINNWILS